MVTQGGSGMKNSFAGLFRKAIVILSAAGILLAGFMAFGGFHYLKEYFGLDTDKSASKSGIEAPVAPEYPEGIPREIATRDHSVLKLVPGGEFMTPAHIYDQGEVSVTVNPFYLDEAPVTNQQYVDFLNKVRKKLTVDGNVVRHGNRIYLFLGEVRQGYEPIVFKKTFFRVQHSVHYTCPVVRVTALGALAYARFYGRRLPTVTEWLYVTLKGGAGDETRIVNPSVNLADYEKIPVPVTLLPPNRYGIRGINMDLGCWVRTDSVYQGNTPVIFGRFESSQIKERALPAPAKPKPWDAFGDVGFRCAKDIDKS